MEETRPLPGGAGWLRAQPMTRADSPGHLIRAWRASLLQMCAFLPGQASRGQDHRKGPEQEQRQVWGPRCLPPSLPQWGKFQTATKLSPAPCVSAEGHLSGQGKPGEGVHGRAPQKRPGWGEAGQCSSSPESEEGAASRAVKLDRFEAAVVKQELQTSPRWGWGGPLYGPGGCSPRDSHLG